MAITQADLERRIGPNVLAQLLDDGADPATYASNVADVLNEATDIAHGILKAGFPSEDARAALIENDLAVRGAVLDIATSIAGRRQHTLGGAGPGNPGGPYGAWRKEAEAVLERIAHAHRRARGEERSDVGTNAQIGQQVTRVPNDERGFIFGGASTRKRQPGGF